MFSLDTSGSVVVITTLTRQGAGIFNVCQRGTYDFDGMSNITALRMSVTPPIRKKIVVSICPSDH